MIPDMQHTAPELQVGCNLAGSSSLLVLYDLGDVTFKDVSRTRRRPRRRDERSTLDTAGTALEDTPHMGHTWGQHRGGVSSSTKG